MIGLIGQKEEIFQQAKNQVKEKTERYNQPMMYPSVNDKVVNLIMMEADGEGKLFKDIWVECDT